MVVKTTCRSLMMLAILCLPFAVEAGQSSILEAEGMACLDYTKSQKQTEIEAMTDAKRKASEQASTYIKSHSDMVDFEVQKDLVQAFSDTTVRMLQILGKSWHQEDSLGKCYHLRIQAEVIPNEVAMQKVESKTIEDPTAPLNVKIWTDKSEYAIGETIKLYLRGNKPFFGRVVYQDAKGRLIQLLPNPHRQDHYFEGGIISEIPSGRDQFELEVTPPFGAEKITVYASTEPTGDLDVQDAGEVYLIETKPNDVAIQTRGIAIKKKSKTSGKAKRPSEFAEHIALIRTKGGL
ncbi:MAG: DUF4384 domain-containing protein [Mariprofundaceae bacterium]